MNIATDKGQSPTNIHRKTCMHVCIIFFLCGVGNLELNNINCVIKLSGNIAINREVALFI